MATAAMPIPGSLPSHYAGRGRPESPLAPPRRRAPARAETRARLRRGATLALLHRRQARWPDRARWRHGSDAAHTSSGPATLDILPKRQESASEPPDRNAGRALPATAGARVHKDRERTSALVRGCDAARGLEPAQDMPAAVAAAEARSKRVCGISCGCCCSTLLLYKALGVGD